MVKSFREKGVVFIMLKSEIKISKKDYDSFLERSARGGDDRMLFFRSSNFSDGKEADLVVYWKDGGVAVRIFLYDDEEKVAETVGLASLIGEYPLRTDSGDAYVLCVAVS